MAFYSGLQYVTNGLYLMLDAANTASYPGSGTTWYDVSGNGRNFTLRNTAAYTNTITGNSSVKYMNFRNSSCYAANGTGHLPSDTNGITLCLWTRVLETTGDWRTLMRGLVNDHQIMVEAGSYRLGMYDNQNATGFNDSEFSIQNLPGWPIAGGGTGTLIQTNTQWVMMVWKFQPTAPYYQFQLNNNSTALGAISSANARFKNSFYEIGSAQGGGSQYWGDIAVFAMYDRILTQAEINQNYDAFAPRFNGGTGPSDAGAASRQINVFPGIIPLPDDTKSPSGAILQTDGVSGTWVYQGGSQNLVNYPYAGAYAGAGTGFVLSNNTDTTGGASINYVTGVDNPVGAPGILRYYTGTAGYKYFAFNVPVPAAGTYIMSYYARISGGTAPSNLGLNQIWRDAGVTDRTPTGDWNPSYTSEWKRYYCYAYVTTSLDFFIIHSGSLLGGYTVDFCGFQLEPGTSATVFKPSSSFRIVSTQFRYRSILTHGYIAGGYKGSAAWKSVNRTWHATDTTLYCGEQLTWAANYVEGIFSDYNGYILNGADAYATASQQIQSFSLANGTVRSRGGSTYSPPGSGFIPTDTGTSGVGGWALSSSRGPYVGGAVNQMGQYGYASGGNTANTCDKMSYATEIMIATNAAPAGAGYHSGCHGQYNGYWSLNGSKYYIAFSNDTWGTYANSHNTGWMKFLSTKWGFHYGSTNGVAILKFNDSNGSDISAATSRPRSVSEENFQMGQDWGYMLGQFDGQQTNQTLKYTHATDAAIQLGVAAQPKGHFGQSSAACASAAATICGTTSGVGF